jgi:hypothetical protein
MARFAVAVFLLVGIFGGYHMYQLITSPTVSVTPVSAAEADKYPSLNPCWADAWAVPSRGVHARGQYHDPATGMSLRVSRGQFGSFTLDDACTAAQRTGSPLAYWVDFQLVVRDAGHKPVSIGQSDFQLTLNGSSTYNAIWNVPQRQTLMPGHTLSRETAFQDLPRGPGIYTLEYAPANGGSALVATYRVYPNGRTPLCS